MVDTVCLVAPAVLAGIFNIPRIQGVTNTVVHGPVPQQATYQRQLAHSDAMLAPKIAQLLEGPLPSKGLTRVDQNATLLVSDEEKTT